MKIGFDFDNTIVSYDELFHKVASEKGVIDATVPINKLAVREYLRANNQETIWTEMQGYVYGARLIEAKAYPNVIEVMARLIGSGHDVAIISHRTKYPYLGEQYDLHIAARGWIREFLQHETTHLITENNIFLELTKEDKLKRIRNFECDIFIDDLPEILLAPLFPDKTLRFLFDPEKHHQKSQLVGVTRFSSWNEFEKLL